MIHRFHGKEVGKMKLDPPVRLPPSYAPLAADWMQAHGKPLETMGRKAGG